MINNYMALGALMGFMPTHMAETLAMYPPTQLQLDVQSKWFGCTWFFGFKTLHSAEATAPVRANWLYNEGVTTLTPRKMDRIREQDFKRGLRPPSFYPPFLDRHLALILAEVSDEDFDIRLGHYD